MKFGEKTCKLLISAVVLLALLGGIGKHAAAEAVSAHEHQWNVCSNVEQEEFPYLIELVEVTNVSHAYMRYFPVKRCLTCDEIQYGGSASYAMHSYVVQEYHFQQEKEMIVVTWKCKVCKYQHTEQCEVQLIKEGKMPICLLGGSCEANARGYLYDNGIILPEMMGNVPVEYSGSEKLLLHALIYNEQNQSFLQGYRQYCPLCGRPRIESLSQPTTKFKEKWNGLPIMTEQYFLTVDMPQNLPYQLIDTLRQESGAT